MDIIHPRGDLTFRRPQYEPDLDFELVFEDAAELTNPLSAPLVAALRKVRALQEMLDSYRAALKVAIDMLHTHQGEVHNVRRRNRELVDEVRARRRNAA